MITQTPQGLFCAAGNFYIDPSRAVEHAVITHAHSDHARRGSAQYYCVRSGEGLLRARIGQKISVSTYNYQESFEINGVKLSFHPAGHILGSSQVRMEYRGQVWVASGDYKRDPDPTCEPFEVVPCDVFVTEATFGTPGFRWNKNANLGQEIFEWWRDNSQKGINSVLFAYSLGKAQRVLGVLHNYMKRPVYCHSAVSPINQCYLAQGIRLAPTVCLSEIDPDLQQLRGELVLVPPSFLKSDQASILGDQYETAFASGWTARKGRPHESFDKGFVMSDHADWDDLVRTVQETGARKVYVQHRGYGALVRHLKSLGLQAFPVDELIDSTQQLSFFDL